MVIQTKSILLVAGSNQELRNTPANTYTDIVREHYKFKKANVCGRLKQGNIAANHLTFDLQVA